MKYLFLILISFCICEKVEDTLQELMLLDKMVFEQLNLSLKEKKYDTIEELTESIQKTYKSLSERFTDQIMDLEPSVRELYILRRIENLRLYFSEFLRLLSRSVDKIPGHVLNEIEEHIISALPASFKEKFIRFIVTVEIEEKKSVERPNQKRQQMKILTKAQQYEIYKDKLTDTVDGILKQLSLLKKKMSDFMKEGSEVFENCLKTGAIAKFKSQLEKKVPEYLADIDFYKKKIDSLRQRSNTLAGFIAKEFKSFEEDFKTYQENIHQKTKQKIDELYKDIENDIDKGLKRFSNLSEVYLTELKRFYLSVLSEFVLLLKDLGYEKAEEYFEFKRKFMPQPTP